MIAVQPVVAVRRDVAVLVGFESSGKSAVFRNLTGQVVADEANFRGSTISCRSARLVDGDCDVVDTPGIRVRGDTETARRALSEVSRSDVAVLVVRGTSVVEQLRGLLRELRTYLRAKRVAVVVTFADLAHPVLTSAIGELERAIGVPVVLVNARAGRPIHRDAVISAIQRARHLRSDWELRQWPAVERVTPKRTLLDGGVVGALVALTAMLLLFVTPVYAAYEIASYLQGPCERLLRDTVHASIAAVVAPGGVLYDLSIGSYGILSLGVYSFIWALPVVALIAASVAIAEETGLNERITTALDPLLKAFGLSGRDLVPVLTGFGCNVVAIHQSRACSRCTRSRCVSLIAFGSACSYQIGASLSLFNSAGRPWLFMPYIAIVFLVGAIHSRVWHGRPGRDLDAHACCDTAFLQPIRPSMIWLKTAGTVRQFLFKAMPIFLGTCVAGALLSHFGVIDYVSAAGSRAFGLFGIPREAVPGILLSGIRKDGLLVLNADGAATIRQLSAGGVFMIVYLASTWSPCFVTIWTMARELGRRTAVTCLLQQMASAFASAAVLAALLRVFAR